MNATVSAISPTYCEPAPDEIQDLQEQFVDGEIDEGELEARSAEVWERE